MIRSRSVTAVLGLLAVAGFAGAAEPHADLDPDAAVVTVGVRVEGATDDGAGGGGDAPTIVYHAARAGSPGDTGADLAAHLCVPTGAVEATPDTLGFVWWVTVEEVATGRILDRYPICVAPGDDVRGALARPPTIGEVWDAVGIPAPAIGVSPAGEGVTGLDTWLWSDGPGEVSVAVSLRGYTVTGTARVVEYRFDTGDGSVLRATRGGSQRAPAATHLYETTGVRTLEVAAAWEADATIAGPGFGPVGVDLGRARVGAAREYRVVEVRSVLLP